MRNDQFRSIFLNFILGGAPLAAVPLAISIMAFAPAGTPGPSGALAGADIARALLETQQYDRAVEAYTKQLAENTGDVMVMFNLGTALSFTGDQTRAVEMFKNAVSTVEARKSGDSFENELLSHVYPELVKTLINAGRLDEAIAAAQKGADRFPKDPLVQYAVGEAFRAKGLHEAAIAGYQKSLGADTSDVTINLRIVECYYSMKKYESAGDILRVLLKGHPDNSEVKFNLGSVLYKMEKRDDAIALWKEVAAADPGSHFGQTATQWLDELGVGTHEVKLARTVAPETVECRIMGFSFAKPSGYFMTKVEEDGTSSIFMAGRNVFDETLKTTAEISLSVSCQVLEGAANLKTVAAGWQKIQQERSGGFSIFSEKESGAGYVWEYDSSYNGTQMKGATYITLYKKYVLIVWLNATASTYAKVRSDLDAVVAGLRY